MTTQKGNKVMNNKEIEQVLNKVAHPNNKFLRLITLWTNSTLGMLLKIIAIVVIIASTATYIGKTSYLRDLIALVTAIYILVYKLFDLCVFSIAFDKSFCWKLITIGYILLIGEFSVFAIMYLGTVKWYSIINLFFTVLIYWLEVATCNIFVDTDRLADLKSEYIKEKFGQSKVLKLMHLYLTKK